MADLGTGATLTLATTTTTNWLMASADLGTSAIPAVDDSHLGTTNFRTKLPGDLEEPGTFTFVIQVNSTIAAPITGVVELCTITAPIHTSGNTTNATWTATGFIMSVQRTVYEVDGLQVYTIIFQCDGKSTEPTFTVESA